MGCCKLNKLAGDSFEFCCSDYQISKNKDKLLENEEETLGIPPEEQEFRN